MRRTSSMGFRHWLLTGTLALGMSAVAAVNTPILAQVLPGGPDHLKCYEVLQDQDPPGINEVDLVNKFGLEPNCHVANKARLFCTSVSKFIADGNGDDPRGAGLDTGFTCYRVECPENPIKELAIDDQFGDRHIRIKDARLLCTPTLSEVVD